MWYSRRTKYTVNVAYQIGVAYSCWRLRFERFVMHFDYEVNGCKDRLFWSLETGEWLEKPTDPLFQMPLLSYSWWTKSGQPVGNQHLKTMPFHPGFLCPSKQSWFPCCHFDQLLICCKSILNLWIYDVSVSFASIVDEPMLEVENDHLHSTDSFLIKRVQRNRLLSLLLSEVFWWHHVAFISSSYGK